MDRLWDDYELHIFDAHPEGCSEHTESKIIASYKFLPKYRFNVNSDYVICINVQKNEVNYYETSNIYIPLCSKYDDINWHVTFYFRNNLFFLIKNINVDPEFISSQCSYKNHLERKRNNLAFPSFRIFCAPLLSLRKSDYFKSSKYSNKTKQISCINILV